jgi:hypothetical protein
MLEYKVSTICCIGHGSYFLASFVAISIEAVIMKFLELRGKSLIAIILITSGLDFLLFGCKLSLAFIPA